MILGLTDDEFFRLTPRQYHFLLDRRREQVVHTEFQTGIITSNICNFVANWSMCHGKEPLRLKADDFMLTKLSATPQKKKRRNKKKENQNFTDSARRLVAGLMAQGKVVRAA